MNMNDKIPATDIQPANPPMLNESDYQLSERTLGEWLEYWAETTPDKE